MNDTRFSQNLRDPPPRDPVKSQWTNLSYSPLSFRTLCHTTPQIHRLVSGAAVKVWLTAVLRSAVVFDSVVWVFGSDWFTPLPLQMSRPIPTPPVPPWWIDPWRSGLLEDQRPSKKQSLHMIKFHMQLVRMCGYEQKTMFILNYWFDWRFKI